MELWQHQKDAVLAASELRCYGLFFEQGTGKTATTIHIIKNKMNAKKRFLRTLIVSPIIVLENWKREWLMHSKISEKDILVLKGSEKERCLKLTRNWSTQKRGMDIGTPEHLRDVHKGLVLITNYEGLLMKNFFSMLKTYQPEVIVFDESQKLKDHQSKRAKASNELSKKALHTYILSGTPILNSPMDIFSPFRILDQGYTFGGNFFAFRAKYFYDKNAGMPRDKYFPDWRIRPGAMEEINQKMKTVSMRVEKKDCLDLPPLVRKEILVEMTTEQKRTYEEVKKNLVSYLNDSACVATLAITKALRLMQIASGYVKLEDGREVHIKNNAKAEALKELLTDLIPTSKVIVWAVFKENYEQIRNVCEQLGIKYVEVHGEISNNAKFSNVDAFNTDPSVRVLISHPGSGGIGINLVSSNVSIWFSRNFSLENDLQAEARNYRGGSEVHEKITRIDLVTEGTIEEKVIKVLADKKEIGHNLLKNIIEE